MADNAEPETTTSGTLISDVHMEDFGLADFIVEIATLIQERQAFLNSKLQRKTIGKEDENLALFRLIRMRALHNYLRRIEAHQLGKQPEVSDPAPPIESPLKDFVEEIEAEADKLVHSEPEPLPDKAPPVEEPENDWD